MAKSTIAGLLSTVAKTVGTLYSAEYCPLCREAEGVIIDVLNVIDVQVEVIDISDNDNLVAEYGIHIPVFEFGDHKLYWPFTQDDVYQLLSNIE